MDHFMSAPSRALWLETLRFADFDEVCERMSEPERLWRDCADGFGALWTSAAMDGVLKGTPRTPAVLAHLALVERFVRDRRGVAVSDVVCRVVPGWPEASAVGNRPGRLLGGVALYATNPFHLVDVEICQRWHARRRVVLALNGPRRVVPRAADWAAVGAAACGREGVARFRFVRAFELAPGDVLMAWCEPAEREAVRDPLGAVVAGRREAWAIVRVHRDGNRVDVLGVDVVAGMALADGVAHALWGSGSYRLAREPLTEAAVAEFLERLCDPEDDTFRLLELVGAVPGLPDRPVLTVSNAGRSRVERSVLEFRRAVSLAVHWRHVHRVKVAFDQGSRIEVHLPRSEDDLVLTYSDLERDKHVASAFENLLRDELGVEVQPKAWRTPARTDDEPNEPKRLSEGHWARLLAGVVEKPASWERVALEALRQKGVVRVDSHAVFWCADARAGDPPDTLDCPGEVEMEAESVDPADPMRQNENAVHACSACARPWATGRFRPPAWLRLRVRVDLHAAWRLTMAMVPELHEDEPGVASGLVRGRRAQLVFVPLAEAEPWLLPDLAATAPTAWLSLVGDPRLASFGDRGVSLARLLADGAVAVRRILDLGRVSRVPMATALLAASPAPSPYRVLIAAPAAEPPRPERHVLSLDGQGVWLDGTRIASAKAAGVRFFLALLAEAAARDEATAGGRRYHSTYQLQKLAGGTVFQDADVHTWVSRTRLAIRTEFADSHFSEVVVQGDRGGYRLGPAVVATGFVLASELQARLGRRDGPRD